MTSYGIELYKGIILGSRLYEYTEIDIETSQVIATTLFYIYLPFVGFYIKYEEEVN